MGRMMLRVLLLQSSPSLLDSGVVSDGGADAAVAPSGTCQKGGTLRCQKIGLSFSVQKRCKKAKKNYPRLFFFSLPQVKLESYVIQSV